MNERINELAERAAHETRNEHNNAYWRMQDEISEDATWRGKFADLIIRECIIQCEREWIRHGTYSLHNQAILGCIKSIKKHFGVEQ